MNMMHLALATIIVCLSFISAILQQRYENAFYAECPLMPKPPERCVNFFPYDRAAAAMSGAIIVIFGFCQLIIQSICCNALFSYATSKNVAARNENGVEMQQMMFRQAPIAGVPVPMGGFPVQPHAAVPLGMQPQVGTVPPSYASPHQTSTSAK